jgi:hypothetical protein
MASDKPETDNFLAQLDARIAALQALRDTYLRAMALGALGALSDDVVAGLNAPTSMVSANGPVDLPTGAFLGKSIPAAVKLYLQAARRKQTVREIADALRDGGMETTATSFEGSVTSALHRMKGNGEVLRFKEGWALAEFYPETLRNRIEKGTKKREVKRRKAGRKPKALAAAPEDALKAVS